MMDEFYPDVLKAIPSRVKEKQDTLIAPYQDTFILAELLHVCPYPPIVRNKLTKILAQFLGFTYCLSREHLPPDKTSYEPQLATRP